MEVSSGNICCFKKYKGHEGCSKYDNWKAQHPMDWRQIVKDAEDQSKSVYIPCQQTIHIYGKEYVISGGIKSLNPPCMEFASARGQHPYTCDNCALQLRDLKDVLRHRQSGSLGDMKARQGLHGMNNRYLRKDEVDVALSKEIQRRRSAEHQLKQLTKVKLSPVEWEKTLLDSCLTGDEEKLVIDLVKLFKMGISKTKPLQVEILRNLTSKLVKKNNSRYVDLIKDIGALFKNELGSTNYALLSNIFGLPGETTASAHCRQTKIDAGLNVDILDEAAKVYHGFPVNEASDGARSLRYLQPRLGKDGEVTLLGKSWSPDVADWKTEKIGIPRKDHAVGDKDDFAALKRTIEKIIEEDKLAKNVSIHNFTCLASVDKPAIIYCMWPTCDKGYTAAHLLKYWEHLRRSCFYDNQGHPRDIPIQLMTYSTDSAGFSLSAAIKLMTPSFEEIIDGVPFLGLGIEEERFLAPYYWKIPSIATLDYDHEQRLFLKNLKYETRELIFWQDDDSTLYATIGHLKDLKDRCQRLGMDCGFNSNDLVLVYFCDQNSDACERLFTIRTAELLDKYIPGSQATSLYIRAVCSLIDPYRRADFGSPEDIQQAVSCGITILRYWRRIVELKKMLINSKPGAKSDPSKRGKFLTYGCYSTAEILFSAATLYQLAMYLHFPTLGVSWSSPGNCGTKSTEKIISEIQGKTTEIQCLDAQPTFVDMLDKSTKVQFNINAKQRLSKAGAQVKQSSKRRQKAFAFRNHAENMEETYSYPSNFDEFRENQKAAHYRGVKDAQQMMEKYMPADCIACLKSSGNWDKPYVFKQPDGISIVSTPPSESFNKLNVSYAQAKTGCIAESEQEEDQQEDSDEDEPSSEHPFENSFDGNDECENEGHANDGSKWKISKMVDGMITQVHVKQAIKLLLPREYISRSRQKRHWASKYLPGKAPIDPKHDVMKFCNVAMKSVFKGKQVFDVVRIEMIESLKDGTDVQSFALKPTPQVRLRCSLYEYKNGIYNIPPFIRLTSWKAPSSIIGPVELVPIDETRSGSYHLHEVSKRRLQELGFCQRGDISFDVQPDELSSLSEDDDNLPEDFYEVETIVNKRLSKTTHEYEYQVRFKGYGKEDDMWLPASHFNRVISFQSQSKFGRTRRHQVKPDGNEKPEKKTKANRIPATKSEKPLKKRKAENGSSKERTFPKSLSKKRTTVRSRGNQSSGSESDVPLSSVKRRKILSDDKNLDLVVPSTSQKACKKPVQIPATKPKKASKKRKAGNGSSKGMIFRKSLRQKHTIKRVPVNHSSGSESDVALSSVKRRILSDDEELDVVVPSTSQKACKKPLQIISDSEEEDLTTVRSRGNHSSGGNEALSSAKRRILSDDEDLNVVAPSTSQKACKKPVQIISDGEEEDLTLVPSTCLNTDPLSLEAFLRGKCQNASREEQSKLCTPNTNAAASHYSIVPDSCTILNPLKLKEIPPESAIKECEVKLEERGNDYVAHFHSLGYLNIHGIRVIKKLLWLKQLKREVAYENKWIAQAFQGFNQNEMQEVKDALLNRPFKTTFQGSNVTSNELASLCGERYLSDEVISYLIKMYCAEANTDKCRPSFLVLSSFLLAPQLTPESHENILENHLSGIYINLIKALFLPYHMIDDNHWGLVVFWLKEKTVRFDDGQHCRIPEDLKKICFNILSILYRLTGDDVFDKTNWKVARFQEPMPYQHEADDGQGSGSCGVGVILSARDYIKGCPFSWSFKDSMYLRATIMVEIVRHAASTHAR